jgi:ribosome modulation factor
VKATVTENENGIEFVVEDDGSEPFRHSFKLTKDATERERAASGVLCGLREDANHEAWCAGAVARAAERSRDSCPWKRGDIRRKSWLQGWDAINRAAGGN